MHEYIKLGIARSVRQAAQKVVGKAGGSGEERSRLKRLQRGYRKRFGLVAPK
jgi:hypothetical protein